MPELPTGTVTFLFTDIEASTAGWEHRTAAMHHALARHDALLRAAIRAHRGTIVKGTGDGVHAAFWTAQEAVSAAIAAQRALQSFDWGEAGSVRVRMALHAGAAEERDGDYFGPTLNRAARLMSVGYGGQVLLSDVAQQLVHAALHPDVTLRDLGVHRLKDLIRPERIFQLVTPDLPADFPELRTLDVRAHNLPIVRDPLIGREHEVAEVVALLKRTDVGLVTLTGPGGTGKTRLGLQLAAELLDPASRSASNAGQGFTDGVWLVELAPIVDPALVASTIAQVLGVKESGDKPILETLREDLRAKHLLLVLDNFEQVIAAAPVVTDLLNAAPALKVLVSSREALHLSGEYEYPVPPLALPDPHHLPNPELLTQYAAVAFFVQRAQAIQPAFRVTSQNASAIAGICVRLDGLPLAIELAAARIKVFTPQSLRARLAREAPDRLGLLTGGPRDRNVRQQTLRGTIDWSYNLIPPVEQQLFARLAVFIGGCSIEAAEAVFQGQEDEHFPSESSASVLDLLQSLLDKSLVRQDELYEEPRIMMLETIREYALERLELSGEAEALRRRHALYFVELAEKASPELRGAEQAVWVQRLERDHDNLRTALRWLLDAQEGELAVRLAGSLWRFWYGGYLSEGRRWIESALAASSVAASGSSMAQPAGVPRARALTGAGALALFQSDYDPAIAAYSQSLALYRALPSTADTRRGITGALNGLGIVAERQGDLDRAIAYYEETLTLARAEHDMRAMAVALNNLGVIWDEQGDLERARSVYEESVVLARRIGDRRGMAGTLNNLGLIALAEGTSAQSLVFFNESLSLYRALGFTQGIAHVLHNLGFAWLEQGNLTRSRAMFVEGLVIVRDLDDQWLIAEALEGVALVAAGQVQDAADVRYVARIYGRAASLRSAIGAPLSRIDAMRYERYLATARAAVASTAWNAAILEGEALPLAHVIAQVLEQPTASVITP